MTKEDNEQSRIDDEIIQSWKDWHLKLSNILGCKYLMRGITIQAVKDLVEENKKLKQDLAREKNYE